MSADAGPRRPHACLEESVQRACNAIADGWARGTRMTDATHALVRSLAVPLGVAGRHARYLGLASPGAYQTTIEPADPDTDGACSVCGRPARGVLCVMDDGAVRRGAPAVAVPPLALCLPHLVREQAFIELVLLSRSALRADLDHIRRLVKLAAS